MHCKILQDAPASAQSVGQRGRISMFLREETASGDEKRNELLVLGTAFVIITA